jgi:hypothetical protein
MSRFAEYDAELSRPAVNCKLCREVDALDDEDAAFVRSLLEQPVTVKGHAHIARVLKAGGVSVSVDTIEKCRGRHIR